MGGFYCVVYYKSRMIYSRCTIADAMCMYLSVWCFGNIDGWDKRNESVNLTGDNPAIDIFIDRLIVDHEIHVTHNEGERLLDIYYVSG